MSSSINLDVSKLVLACRNVHKGKDAITKILHETGRKDTEVMEVWEVDLSNYASVLSFAERVRTELPRLDGFIANAGVEMTEYHTAEDLELTLTVNVVSTFLSTIAILPKLKETSVKYGVDTTLTITGSKIHTFGPDAQLDIADNQDIFVALSDRQTADTAQRYPLSKLIVHQCFNELVQHYSFMESDKQHQVIANLVDPGWCATELGRSKSDPLIVRMIFALIGRTAEQGGRTLTTGITAGKDTHGGYMSECRVKAQSNYVQSERGQRIQKKLWKDLMAILSRISPETARIVS